MRSHGPGSAEQIPVKSLRNGFFRRKLVGQRTREVFHLDLRHLSDSAFANELAGETIHLHRSLLAADLEYAPVTAHGTDQLFALANCQRQWLLTVDIQTAWQASIDACTW